MPSIDEKSLLAKYWRTLEEAAGQTGNRELFENEFPVDITEAPDEPTRRSFMKLVGASLGLAGLAGCRWPKEKILPFSRRPVEYIPGVPMYFATSMDMGGVAQGLLVSSYDGRPIKIEGNELHPDNLGASDIYAQASVLDLYDPDRSRLPILRQQNQEIPQKWSELDKFLSNHFNSLKINNGTGLAVLAESSSSPTFRAVKSDFLLTFPQAKWFEYESISWDNEREGTRSLFGTPVRPLYRMTEVQTVVCLDADLFGNHPAHIRYSREFMATREPEKARSGGIIPRLYVFEPSLSVSGGLADHRYPVCSQDVLPLLCQLISEMNQQGLSDTFLSPELNERIEQLKKEVVPQPVIAVLAKELLHNRGKSILASGYRQGPEVHALIHLMNTILENSGQTVVYLADPEPDRPTHLQGIADLSTAISAGQVNTLLILGGNPVFNAPADLDFKSLLSKVSTTIQLGLHRDETAVACHWHIPAAHYLEYWGDGCGYDGTHSSVQPLIQPLYDGRSALELIAQITRGEKISGYDLVREHFRNRYQDHDFESAWRQFLNDGIRTGSGFESITPTIQATALVSCLEKISLPETKEAFEVTIQPSALYDGRFANNAWLQELPDFITKLTWDNALLISPSSAQKQGLKHGDLVQLTCESGKVEFPVLVQPGQAAGCLTIQLGYGRTVCGRIGTGVGRSIEVLRTIHAMNVILGASLEKTGLQYPLATTQEHHLVDQIGQKGRDHRVPELVRETTLSHYLEHPDFAKHVVHVPPLIPLWQEHEYGGQKWGMTIDLNKCTGCNACVIACQSENNIPVVGKEQVLRSREMHWLRIDRYFSGDVENPTVVHQPLACVHCENAPCEQVCPVGATMHDQEGLNVMVYNRCVGTRYCSNNCPYKVRRFNFFNYHKNLTTQDKMVHNPDVTVRVRGVMEKCTYCVQRISRARIIAKNERRPVLDGEIIPACAQACPSQAIVFGNLNDPESTVIKLQGDPRSYFMLEETNVKPRTAYLARVRNPHPDLIVESSTNTRGAHEHSGHS